MNPQSLGRCYIIWFINEKNSSRDGKEDNYFFSVQEKRSIKVILRVVSVIPTKIIKYNREFKIP